MEKHNYNLCFNPNTTHIRSQFLNLYVNPKPPSPPPPSPSSEDEVSDGYNLRKKSFRSGHSEISFAGESETESARNATVRRRSKRIRKPEISWFGDQRHFHRYNKTQKKSMITVSDFSPEEDVAHCLMMLSRDRWTNEHKKPNESDENDSESETEILNVKGTPARSKYRCDTCKKVFRSYQALGGHRASHKKIKLTHHNNKQQSRNIAMGDKLHECPVCFKVFASGQALGGHKRSHVTASSSSITTEATPITKQRVNLIDLNLPAPIEDDDISQMEVSVVSDCEFVKPH